MSILWPSGIPQCPTLDTYSETPVDNRLISNVDAGPRKIRRRFTAAPIAVSERYIMTKAEYLAFKSWYENDIQSGSLRFIKKHPIEGVDKEYRFVDVYSQNQLGLLYEIILSLEIMPV